jgi:hypothetical protein
MKAIHTKYIPATNCRGSRIKAWAEGGASITVPYDCACNRDEAHDKAALALVLKMGWKGFHSALIRGGSADGRGNVYTFEDEYNRVPIPSEVKIRS